MISIRSHLYNIGNVSCISIGVIETQDLTTCNVITFGSYHEVFMLRLAVQILFRRSSVKQAGVPKPTVFVWTEIEAVNSDYFPTCAMEQGIILSIRRILR